MDLRDQFAIAAMQGLLADGWMPDQSNDGWMADQSNIAELAYRQADAMLAERGKFHGLVTLPKSTFDAPIQENSELKLEIEALKGGVQ